MSDSFPELRRYKILEMIGCGGMGYVYAGYDLKTETPVAIKVLAPECLEIPAVLQRFKLEGSILRSLSHPNIVRFVECGQEGETHFLAMEYIKGISLDSLPRSHSANSIEAGQNIPTIEEYLTIFLQCLDALSYVHKQGLIHRDIKPQNIILQGDSLVPRLLDFGIAKHLKGDDDLNTTAEQMFTVVYASPEQLTNKPLDPLSDLFSFGVVMYEKLTGRLPFPGKKAMEVFIGQTKWNFSPPRQVNPEIPQKLEQIILKMLAKDPTHRYPSAAMVQSEIEKLLGVMRSSGQGLGMTGIVGEIREFQKGSHKTFKRSSLSDEVASMKKARNEVLEAKTRLRMAKTRSQKDPEQILQLETICQTLHAEYERMQIQTKMSLGFKSSTLVIDRFNSIQKLETLVYEKQGVAFTTNTIEQKLAHLDGSDIVVGSLNFSERAKRLFSRNIRDSFFAWDESNWFFQPYDEKEFPNFILVGDRRMTKPPPGFKGFFWPCEFVMAIHKLQRTGVAIVETFKGVDRQGRAAFAQHKAIVLFSQNLFDLLSPPEPVSGKDPGAPPAPRSPAGGVPVL